MTVFKFQQVITRKKNYAFISYTNNHYRITTGERLDRSNALEFHR